jgi:hypothetical protein
MKSVILFTVAAAVALIVAGDAEAQSRNRTLADGRVLTIPGSIADCRLTGSPADTPAQLALDFACQVPSREGGPADTSGQAGLVILGQAAAISPDAFLAGQLETWWPGIDAAGRASNIRRSRKATANGEAAVVCVHRDDIEALAGDAVCILDQPGIQVLIAGRSTMALTADNVIDTVMKGLTLR